MSGLESSLRVVGVLISVVGAFLVAPEATKLMLRRSRAGLARAGRHVGEYLGLIHPAATGPAIHVASVVQGSGAGTGTVTGTGTGGPPPTTEERVRLLETRVGAIDELLARTRHEAARDRDQQRHALVEARQAMQERLDALNGRLDNAEAAAVETDARALPVVGVGIFLSGLSPDLARVPVVGIPVMLLAVAVTGWAYLNASQERRARAG